jgi:deazaflavin-dependent oxidoreductase (nitroreductase family)
VTGDPRDLDFCYLTTTGRRTGAPHRIEIWFALHDEQLYLLSGGGDRSDWVRNVLADARVTIELGSETRSTLARAVTDPDEDQLARRLLVDKYQPRDRDDLGEWGRTAMPLAAAWSATSEPAS